MKFPEPLESQRLVFLLESAASREAQMWKVHVPKNPSNQDTDISPAQRDEAVRWLFDLHSDLELIPETLSLAVCTLDRFLSFIKARPKYLRCIAIACFFLAAKTSEEDECVPTLRELVTRSKCGCTPAEVLRMERIVLDKLNWDLHTATPLHFLHIFHAMALSRRPPCALGSEPSRRLALLTRQLHGCLAEQALLQAKGSTLALALVTLELERQRPDWLALTVELLRRAQIDSAQLIRCRELVARHLSARWPSLPPNTVYIYQPPQSRPPPSRKPSAKRKVEEMEVDDFYDGIKRLYSEESGAEGAAVSGGGAAASPCPPLQPVSVT